MKEAGVADTVVMTRPVRPQEGGISAVEWQGGLWRKKPSGRVWKEEMTVRESRGTKPLKREPAWGKWGTVRNKTGQAGQLMKHVGCRRSVDFTLGASLKGPGGLRLAKVEGPDGCNVQWISFMFQEKKTFSVSAQGGPM